MNQGTTVKFDGYIQSLDHTIKTIVHVKGELTKKNNKIWGNYTAKRSTVNNYINIPYDISGYIDKEGYLCIETYTNTFLRGLLTKNKIYLNGLNTNGHAVRWIISIY